MALSEIHKNDDGTTFDNREFKDEPDATALGEAITNDHVELIIGISKDVSQWIKGRLCRRGNKYLETHPEECLGDVFYAFRDAVERLLRKRSEDRVREILTTRKFRNKIKDRAYGFIRLRHLGLMKVKINGTEKWKPKLKTNCKFQDSDTFGIEVKANLSIRAYDNYGVVTQSRHNREPTRRPKMEQNEREKLAARREDG